MLCNEKSNRLYRCKSIRNNKFEFYVDDNATDAEIAKLVDDECDYYIDYSVEEGYEPVTEIVYKKKG